MCHGLDKGSRTCVTLTSNVISAAGGFNGEKPCGITAGRHGLADGIPGGNGPVYVGSVTGRFRPMIAGRASHGVYYERLAYGNLQHYIR